MLSYDLESYYTNIFTNKSYVEIDAPWYVEKLSFY